MSIKASDLNKAGTRGKDLEAVIREHILIIDTRLQESAKTWGRNILTYDLPTNFSFPGLEKKNSQRIIYAAIIRSLQERGFTVRILLDQNRTCLFIEWVTQLSQEEMDSMTKLIHDVHIPSNKVNEYLKSASMG